MTTHKNTKRHTTIATLLLFSIGILFSCNTFAGGSGHDHHHPKPYAIHKLGEAYGGGRVFYVYDGGQHGLIAALADQGTGIQWDNGIFKLTGTTGDGLGAGAMNTAIIVATQINDTSGGNFAAKVCADYSVTAADGVTYGDWYLPSKAELNLLYNERTVVDGFANATYWSSTEIASKIAWGKSFVGDPEDYNSKSDPLRVRAVRAF
jgi:Protein of unknown function (DUF1566)